MSKTAQKHNNKKETVNTNSIKLKKINMSDDESGIHNLLVDATQNPQKMKPQGVTILSVFTAVSEKYDISINDLTNNMISCDYEDYKTQTRRAMEIVRKKDKKKEEKFQAYQVNSSGDFVFDKKNKKIPLKHYMNNSNELKIRTYFQKNYRDYLRDKDKDNTKYFKNGKFNIMSYINLKWQEIKDPSHKTYQKLFKNATEENDKIMKEIERQKQTSGFIEKPKKSSAYNLFIKIKSDEYKDKESFKKLDNMARIPYIAKQWEKLGESKKSKYVNMADEHNKLYTIQLKKWEEYNKKKNGTPDKESSKESLSDNNSKNSKNNDNIYDASTDEENSDNEAEASEESSQLDSMINIIQGNNSSGSNGNANNTNADNDSDNEPYNSCNDANNSDSDSDSDDGSESD